MPDKEEVLRRLPAVAAGHLTEGNENEFSELMELIRTHI